MTNRPRRLDAKSFMALAGITVVSPDELILGVSRNLPGESAARLRRPKLGRTAHAPPKAVVLQKSRRFMIGISSPARLPAWLAKYAVCSRNDIIALCDHVRARTAGVFVRILLLGIGQKHRVIR